jgi:histidinol-phosphate/aromatic aminotransferase/cobyric acid decarboxylase-like protein
MSAWLTERLLTFGVAVRDASNFVGLDGRYVRVAVGLPEHNRRLVAALFECLATEGEYCDDYYGDEDEHPEWREH